MAVGALPDPPPAATAAEWHAVFGNAHPVAIEVGPGRGEFLQAIAQARPGWNFLAIERSAARTRSITHQIELAAAGNARVLCADATCLLALLPAGCVSALFVQFPDPWWKRRHHRRRLWTPAFAATVRRVLAPGATIEFLTDVADTFHLGLACLDGDGGFEHVTVGRLPSHATSFAHKALRRGGTIYHSVHRRRS